MIQVKNDQSENWSVSLPCSVQQDGRVHEAVIDKLHAGGARLTEMSLPLDQGTAVTVKFCFQEQGYKLSVSLLAKVVYATRSDFKGQSFHSVGVEFEDPPSIVAPQLTPLFLRLRSKSASGK